ncbi:hypothetical protein [Methylocystis sp. B8]|uniref:serine O-acetyltransferase n=1 Tax=Methylocystis sp. B8 TaxID=544938 RepID=UPI001AEDC178|nr:hypothetical protein [Methylocystis sp. B8]
MGETIGAGIAAAIVAAASAEAKPHLRGCATSLGEVRALLRADLYRYAGDTRITSFIKHFGFTPGFKYTVWMRYCGWAKRGRVTGYALYPFLKWMLLRCRYKYGIAIPEYTVIGPGFFINRFGGVYFVGDVVIGCNVNVTHGTVLGHTNRGARRGAPVVGDRVFFASGAKVVGHVFIGDDAAVGVNSVVTKDVAASAVVGGIPAKQLSVNGSEGYINRQASEEMIRAAGWEPSSTGRRINDLASPTSREQQHMAIGPANQC